MTGDEVISQCVLFFFAAYENTSSIISLALYNLAVNQAAQSQLYDEIVNELETLKVQQEKDNSKKNGNNFIKLISIESLSSGFKYLSAVVDETLRLFPPNSTSRTANKDILLTSTGENVFQLDIRKGDVIHIPVYAIQHDSKSFPEPETFKPERFLGTSKSTFHRYAFLPFGQGSRNCVPESLARVEIKLVIIGIISRYKLTVSSQTDVPLKFYNNGQTLAPKAVRLQVTER